MRKDVTPKNDKRERNITLCCFSKRNTSRLVPGLVFSVDAGHLISPGGGGGGGERTSIAEEGMQGCLIIHGNDTALQQRRYRLKRRHKQGARL